MMTVLTDDLEDLMPSMRRFALSLTRDATQADDLLQDTLERALANQDRFQKGTNLRAWAFSIMRNRFISDCRRRTRSPLVEAGEDPTEQKAPATQESVVELQETERAFGTLSESEQQMLVMASVDELPYAEIARIQGIAVGTVKSRVARARTRLREAVRDQRGSGHRHPADDKGKGYGHAA